MIFNYLTYTKSFNENTKKEAKNIVNGLYQHMINNKFREDGSYDLWDYNQNSTTSSWLTAHAAKILILAMNRGVISSEGAVGLKVTNALNYLKLKSIQESPTSVYFTNEGYNKNPYIESSSNSNFSTTAHVIIALLHYKKHNSSDNSYDELIEKSMEYLEDKSTSVDIYCSAIFAYTQSLKDQDNKSILENLKKNTISHNEESYINISLDGSFLSYKRGQGVGMYNIIATSYVALSYLRQNSPDKARPYIKWLLKIKKGGTMYEKYDSAIAMEAITEFAKTSSKVPDFIVHFNNKNATGKKVKVFQENEPVVINRSNSNKLHFYDLGKKSKSVTIKIEGKGFLIVEVGCDTYRNESVFDNEMFQLNISTTNGIHPIIKLCLTYKPPKLKNAYEMILAEVQLPSGYIYEEKMNSYETNPYVRVSNSLI